MVNFIPLISNSKKLEWGSSEGPDLDEDVFPLGQKDVPTLAWEQGSLVSLDGTLPTTGLKERRGEGDA